MSESTNLIRKLIAEQVAAGAHTSAGIAAAIAESHPDDVDTWLEEHATQLFTSWVSDVIRSWRLHLKKRKPSVEHLATDIHGWLEQSFPIDEDDNRLPMAKINRAGALYIADEYKRAADEDLFYEAKWRHIAKKLTGGKTIGEVFTNDDLDDLFHRGEN